ncbi:MAG TPA: helix-turn-helix domain-containing protein [Baekduia sp.]|nr:helix-turn-helix domain-containing protein [Baekduia sp.]
MEASATATRSLESDKAQRIVEAMRESVAQRGVAGATFDHVARRAGVSRGLLHYYFGTKERLLTEVVRRDCDLRMGVLEAQLTQAASAQDVVELLRLTLEDMVRDAPDFFTVVFEFFTLSRRNDEVAAELADLLRRTAEHVAKVLRAKQEEGVLVLRAEPEAVAEILFALGDGIGMRMLVDPDRDWSETVRAGLLTVQALIADA